MKNARKFFLLALIIVLVDQAVKLVVKLNMDLGESFRVLGDVFKIHFIENEGAAFGLTLTSLFSGVGLEMSPTTGKLILSIFSILALAGIGYLLFRLSDHRSPLPWFLAMIFGGALGNIIDRTFYGAIFSDINAYDGGLLHGRVVDMFYLDIYYGPYPDWVPWAEAGDTLFLWPIFNIADVAISVGIVVILVFQGKFFRQHEARTQAQAVATPHEENGGSENAAHSEKAS